MNTEGCECEFDSWVYISRNSEFININFSRRLYIFLASAISALGSEIQHKHSRDIHMISNLARNIAGHQKVQRQLSLTEITYALALTLIWMNSQSRLSVLQEQVARVPPMELELVAKSAEVVSRKLNAVVQHLVNVGVVLV